MTIDTHKNNCPVDVIDRKHSRATF